MVNAVELDKLRKTFQVKLGSGFKRVQKEVVAVDEISLTVPSGQSVAFMGPNGAGKSTTIKMLTGILRPTSGSASILGLNPWNDRSKLAFQIGVVFGQRSQLWYHLPPRDTFDLLAKVYELAPNDYKQRRDVLIERFKLESFLNVPVRKLSLGQRMRAEIAASLLHRPRLIFLDEPTIGLDVIARQELRDLICEWNRDEGVTVFLTSHDAGDIESVADRVVVINHGRLVLDSTVVEMRRDYLSAKLLTVVFHDRPLIKQIAGVKEIERSEHSCKLELDTTLATVGNVVQEIMTWGAVADISIEDPPLEDVIAHIYNSKQVPVPDVLSGCEDI